MSGYKHKKKILLNWWKDIFRKEQEGFKLQATSVILGFSFVEEDGTRMGRVVMIFHDWMNQE